MLSVRGLRVVLGETVALDDVDLDLAAGEVLAVLGPSGCGKSTLLRTVAGLERPDAGRVTWDGEDLTTTPTHRRGFALMFQDGQLFDHLTVARNVGYAPRLRRRSDVDVDDLLELVGLGGYGDRLPRTLSGGERQRVALARSLAAEPRLLLLDEPLSALDADLRTRLADDLRRILTEAGTTALFVTHDQDEAFAVADTLAVMRGGRIVQHGPTTDVWAHPVDAATARFLGYAAVLDPAAAATLLATVAAPGALGAGPLALRQGALVVDADRPTCATVVAVRRTPDAVLLRVDVDGVGVVAAVAGRGTGAAPQPGERVGLRLDPTAAASLPGEGPDAG